MSTIRGLDSIENLMRLCPGAVVTNTGLSPGDPWHGFGGREDVRRAPKLVTPSVAKPRKLPRITEAEFLDQVIKFAKLHGWRVTHFRTVRVQRKDGTVYYQTPVQADGAGFVDLLLARERVVYAEVKTDKGRLESKQRDWMEILKETGQEVYVWRPRDWTDIQKCLQ